MKAAIQVVCRSEVAVGFGLAGLEVTEANDGAACASALAELERAPAAGGVVLVEQALFDQLAPALVRRIRARGMPILVPFPSPSLAAERQRADDEEVLEILRRAVGYRVRLR